jgi:phosphoserine phosphatase
LQDANPNPNPNPNPHDELRALTLQDAKTEFYKALVDESAEARPGALALMDAALAAEGLAVGICSASTRAGFDRVRRADTVRSRA